MPRGASLPVIWRSSSVGQTPRRRVRSAHGRQQGSRRCTHDARSGASPRSRAAGCADRRTRPDDVRLAGRRGEPGLRAAAGPGPAGTRRAAPCGSRRGAGAARSRLIRNVHDLRAAGRRGAPRGASLGRAVHRLPANESDADDERDAGGARPSSRSMRSGRRPRSSRASRSGRPSSASARPSAATSSRPNRSSRSGRSSSVAPTSRSHRCPLPSANAVSLPTRAATMPRAWRGRPGSSERRASSSCPRTRRRSRSRGSPRTVPRSSGSDRRATSDGSSRTRSRPNAA